MRLTFLKVVLVQLAVPSRQDVEEYQNLRSTVNELVGRINGRFGTVEFMPIHFMHKSLAFDELCALYAVSDVCLVSSTRDGMNLVSAQIFVATTTDVHATLGVVRIHCVSTSSPGRYDHFRIRGSCSESQRVHCRQPVGLTTSRKRYS